MVPKISISSVPVGKSNFKVLLSEVVSISTRSKKSPSAITKNSSSSSPNFASKNDLSKVISSVAGSPVTLTSKINSISAKSASKPITSTPIAS